MLPLDDCSRSVSNPKSHSNFRLSTLLLLWLAAIFTLQAQVTSWNVYPVPPAPALPPAGGTFTDPTFGTTLMRVTDANDGIDCHNAYAIWQAFNADDTAVHAM